MFPRVATLSFATAMFALSPAVSPGAWAQAGIDTRTLPRNQVLVVGRVSQRHAAEHQVRMEAFADWLAARLPGAGIRAGKGVVAASPEEMLAMLKDGRVDVVSETIITALYYEERAGAEILMHEWREGRPYYRSVFVTRRDSGISDLHELVGKRIAFMDQGSTSGFLLPCWRRG